MEHSISLHKTGIVLGAVFGLYHLVWAILIAFGWAQAAIDFVLWLYMIKPFIEVDAFNFQRAFGLVVITAVFGYVIGLIFAQLWNWLQR